MKTPGPILPTNMRREDMIPDCINPAHDSQFWCVPPMRDSPNNPVQGGGGKFPFYLVTQGHQVGIWRNWTIVKAMVDGYPSGAQCGHQTVEACVDEWQLHCPHGVHPHPADPQVASASTPGPEIAGSASPTKAPGLGSTPASWAVITPTRDDHTSRIPSASTRSEDVSAPIPSASIRSRTSPPPGSIIPAHSSIEEPAIIVLEKPEQRRRHRVGEPKAKPGKESWVHGTKLTFFSKQKDMWMTASETNDTGSFYTKMARLFVAKYGYLLKDNEDLAVDTEDPADSVTNLVNLRDKIGWWYHAQYRSLLKSDKAAFKELFTGVLDGAPPKPQCSQITHFYSRHYYEKRVKSAFEARWDSLQRSARYSGEKVPADIVVKNQVIKEMWEDETHKFQAEVKAAVEREYQLALVGWKASLADSPTRSAEEMAMTLDNAAYYLQPFVDAIAERFVFTQEKRRALRPPNGQRTISWDFKRWNVVWYHSQKNAFQMRNVVRAGCV
ncbi:hypothetical protein B0H13DRAFT_2331394 [Mycena leptocephala]|nr:hypothetical protein B0H13DRAFT_2331394 [Mycena leptocephala]